MNQEIESNLFTWEEIKKVFFEKKFDNVILFSQPRSGSTFVSYVLSKELNYEKNFFPEEFFINQHFVYLKSFVKKHNNFFINTNEYWVRRLDLKKNNTLYLYLYRDSAEILNSYKKAKKLNYYLGWEEMINKYRRYFPEIGNIVPAALFGHKVWEQQIKILDNAYTISYDSFKTHKSYMDAKIRDAEITTLKDIEIDENGNIKKSLANKVKEKKKINFNLLEKIYFYIRRKFESRKKSRKNY